MHQHDGHPMTGRDPAILADLITDDGDDIWMGPDGTADRGDRYSHQPSNPQPRRRKDIPPVVQTITEAAIRTLAERAKALRTDTFDLAAVDPIDAKSPVGTQRRRIAAHNALMDLAVPGRDRYCGNASINLSPCVLRENHRPASFDDGSDHFGAEQRDRAIRYLVHSNPDPDQRA